MTESESHEEQRAPEYEAPTIEPLGSTDELTSVTDDDSVTLDGTGT